MGILALEADERVVDVKFARDTLSVDLRDGRTITVPLAWYPRLFNATAAVPAPASPFGPLSITVAKSKRRSLRHVPASCIADPPHSDFPVNTRSKPRRAPPAPILSVKS